MGTVCSTIFWANCLLKNILLHLSTKEAGKGFFFIASSKSFTSSWNVEKSEAIKKYSKKQK